MGSTEAIHNDTDQKVEVWFQLLGGMCPVGGCEDQLLDPDSKTGTKELTLSLLHQVCVAYVEPSNEKKCETNKENICKVCQEKFSPMMAGDHQTISVSSIIGKKILPRSHKHSSDSDSSSAVEPHNNPDSVVMKTKRQATHSAEEVNEPGPTPNATLNAILEAKWKPNIDKGPHTCTAEDKKIIMKIPGGNADDSWGALINTCGHKGLNIFTGVNQDTFNECFMGEVKGISHACSSCYGKMTQYDFNNCKFQCLMSWCSDACITCNLGSNVIGCIGFVDPQPTPCDGSRMEQVVLYGQALPNVISFTGMALIGLVAFSRVIFSVLRFRNGRTIKTSEEPLMGAYR